MSKISGDINQEMISGRETIETLREQLSVAASEILALRKANKECVEYFNEAQKDLAASQLREQQLRRALDRIGITSLDARQIADDALALPQDASAIEAMIQKAGEVMRERCLSEIDPKYYTHDLLKEVVEGCCGDLRSLPNVTLEDLQK